MKSFKDESFILQFLSPKVIRELKLFTVMDDEQEDELLITAIHDEAGYHAVREALAAQYNLASREPDIEVWNVDRRGDRSLTLRHLQHQGKPLAASSTEVLKHLHRLWGFDIHLQSLSGDKIVKTEHMPPRAEGEGDDLRLEEYLPAFMLTGGIN